MALLLYLRDPEDVGLSDKLNLSASGFSRVRLLSYSGRLECATALHGWRRAERAFWSQRERLLWSVTVLLEHLLRRKAKCNVEYVSYLATQSLSPQRASAAPKAFRRYSRALSTCTFEHAMSRSCIGA